MNKDQNCHNCDFIIDQNYLGRKLLKLVKMIKLYKEKKMQISHTSMQLITF